jgi:predicted RND superfamily exporter protein
MTSLTTAVGFGSLAVSRFSPVRSFGLLSALGIVFAFIITMLLAPASIVYKRGGGLSAAGGSDRVSRLLLSVKRINRKRPRLILIAFTVVIVAGLLGSFRLNVEANTLKFFPADGEIRQTYKFIEENLTGLSPFEILLRGEEIGTPASLAAIDRIENYLLDQPYVTHSFSIRSLQAGFSGSHAPTPPSEGLQIPALFKSLENSFLSEEKTATHISGRGLTMNSILYENAMDEIESFSQSALPEGVTAELTGVVPMITTMDRYLLMTFLKSFAIALVIIGVIMTLNFRSIRLGLLSMIPNTIPILVILGMMGFLRIDLSPATVTVAAISLGIAVDDTIHYIHRYLRSLEEGENPLEASGTATAVVGRAMIYSTLTLASGFIVMVASDFGPTRLFGVLSALCILLALLCDLFLLPVMLTRFDPWLCRKRAPLFTDAIGTSEKYSNAS